MNYRVLENIKLKISKGSLELLPGQVAALPNKVATRLLGEGRITPHETESKVCNVTTETEVAVVTMEPIYAFEETKRLTDVSVDGLEAINRVKSAFSGSTVIEVRTNKRDEREHKAEKLCAKCGKPGQRFCYGEVSPGKYNFGRFCLACYPHHF